MSSPAPHPVLVTGASGFIGRHLVNRLRACGHEVGCVVRATSGADELRNAGAQLILGDVAEPLAMARAVAESRARTVFHLAGAVRALRAGDFTWANEAGVESVAAACAACTEPPVLVVVSSMAAAGPSNGGQPRTESDEPAPVSAYGRSKLAGERAAMMYAGHVPITVVRPPVVFGPGDRGVLEMIQPIARWGTHSVPGRGDDRLSLIHVTDLVDALQLAAEKGERMQPGAPAGHGIYYAAFAEPLTHAELGNALAIAVGKPNVKILHVPRPLVRLLGRCGDTIAQIRGRPVWLNSDKMTEALAGSWTCSAEKARAQLGWSPAATLEQRLAETVAGYRAAGWL